MITVLAVCFMALASVGNTLPAQQESELDVFMQEVLKNRLADWKTRQNYVFLEKEIFEFSGARLNREFYGMEREYNWYVRDGYLVRSPHRIDGVLVTDEEEKRRAEERWIKRMKKEEEEEGDTGLHAEDFFGFEFDKGSFYFTGTTEWNGREVYEVEFYSDVTIDEDLNQLDEDDRIDSLMDNSLSCTMLILPEEKRIVRMVVNNAGFDFLPGRWLVQIETLDASMEMVEALPGTWLPARIEANSSGMTAEGPIHFSYVKEFVDFKRAEVTVDFYVEPESAFNRKDQDEDNEDN